MTLASILFASISCSLDIVPALGQEDSCPEASPNGATIGGEPGTYDGVCRYMGIRYATAERFALPNLAPPTGTIDATGSGTICLHKWGLDNDTLAVQSWPIGQEDCLHLNIFAPRNAIGTNKKLPVMFFIHGGAFVLGAGSWEIYEASNFASRDVVAVTINYRLGPLGFFADDALVRGLEESMNRQPLQPQGNQGLYDQIAALRWVQEYISAFGGDPGNVTIFGESAGAMSVCTLMAAPSSQGLFAAAIMQSGSCTGVSTLEEMAPFAATYATQAGCPVSEAAALSCLQDRDAETLMKDLVFDAVADGLQPTIDGITLTDTPLAMIRERGTSVPLLSGSNLDEVRIVASVQAPLRTLKSASFETFYAAVERTWGSDFTAGAKAIYNSANYADPFEALAALLSDWVLSCPTYVASRTVQELGAASFHYLFQFKPEGAFSDEIGSHHAMELFFVFDALDGYGILFSEDDEKRAHKLSEQMQDAWVNFARSKNPSIPEQVWPAANEGSLVFDTPLSSERTQLETNCAFLEPYLVRGLQHASEPFFTFAEKGLGAP